MAISDETIRLILDIQATKDPAEVASKFEALKGKILETAQAYDVLERQVGEYAVQAERANHAMDKQVEAAVDATRAGKFFAEVYEEMAEKAAFVTTETVGLGNSMTQLKGQGGAGGMGILGVSYAFQDFTSVISGGGGFSRALGSIQNNIPVILTSLGMTAGLAGAVSLVSVGLGAAIPLLTSFTAGEKDVAEAAKEATKAIEHQKAAADALAGKPSPSQAETAQGVTEYLGLVGGENVRQGIEASIAAASPGEGLTQAERQLLADYEHAQVGKGGVGDAMFPGLAADKRRLEAKRAAAIKERTDAIFGTLPTSRDSREAVRRMAAARPGNFPGLPGLASDLQSFEPEDQAMADARMRVAEEEGAAPREAGERRRARAAAANEAAARRKRVEANLEKRTQRDIQGERETEQSNIRDANDTLRAAREKERAEAQARRAGQAVPGVVNQAQRLLQAGRELMQRQGIEREINQRSGGQNSYKDVQEAAKRTLDLTARGVGINDALIAAMHEQGQKIQQLNAHITGQDVAIKQMRHLMRQRQPAGMRRAFPG